MRNSQKIKKLLILVLLVTSMLAPAVVVPASASAAPLRFSADCEDGITPDKCGITAYIVLGIRILTGVVGVVIISMIAYGGIRYSMSRDDPSVIQDAKQHIQNAIIALIVFIFMTAFLQWIVPGGVF